MNRKHVAIALTAITTVTLVAGCSSANSTDQNTADTQLSQYLAAQPTPVFQWSQERATLIALLNARATTTATTSFFFNLGTKSPVGSCPSIGFPLATTTQLTNPDATAGTAGAVVSQIEPTGVYTGASSGTYVVCVNPEGVKYATYWEGDVYTVGGVGKWDDATGTVSLVGEPTVVVKSK